MKKILLSIAFAFMGIASGFAAKAFPGLTTITQSDGSQLSIRLNGDEHAHWYTTSDGVLLVQVGTSYYIAQVEEDGSLKATPQLAHNAAERGTIEKQAIEKQDKEKFFDSIENSWVAAQAKQAGIGNPTIPYFYHNNINGKGPKVLVIPVNFSDVNFTSPDPQATFNHYLNGTAGEAEPEANASYYGKYKNYGSAKQFFTEISQGQFTPEFTVLKPVTVSKKATYYGQGGDGNDYYFSQMITEACQLAHDQGLVNFADYDLNNDGYVDLVYFIYAGYGENINGNDVNLIWPKSGHSNFSLELDGKKFYRYGLQCELYGTPEMTQASGKPWLTGIGLFLHEFTHTMGIPDLYPTELSSRKDNQNPEYWDLMDGGEYTYNGYCPTPYSPWEMDVFGWTSPTELGNDAAKISLDSYAKDQKAYKINAANDEYLLVQNIQKEGWWSHLPNHGLLVWRIDYPYETVGNDIRLNNTRGKPNVMIVPADDYVISDYNHGQGNDKGVYPWTGDEYFASLKGDVFPGTTGRTNLLEVKLNNSTMTNLLYNIKEDNGVITFDYLKDFTTGIDSPTTETTVDKDAPIYTLDGRYLGTDASQLNKGIYIIGKKKVVIK